MTPDRSTEIRSHRTGLNLCRRHEGFWHVRLWGCVVLLIAGCASAPIQVPQEPTAQEAAPQQTSPNTYQPCVQGPELLRFVDRGRVNTSAAGDEASWFFEHLPPLTRQRLLAAAKAEIARSGGSQTTINV